MAHAILAGLDHGDGDEDLDGDGNAENAYAYEAASGNRYCAILSTGPSRLWRKRSR